MNELLKCGIYVIINKKLNTVYVGQTRKNFLVRWIEHLQRIEKYKDDLHRFQLYLDEHTQFLVVKQLEEKDVLEFYEFENKAMDFYRERGWLVVSARTSRTKEGENNSVDTTKRQKMLLRHITAFLGAADVKENYVGWLLSGIYRKIDKDFKTNVRERANGKSVLDALTKEEIEHVLIDLYPRYKAKRLALLRKEYGI